MTNTEKLIEQVKKELEIYEKLLKEFNNCEKDFILAILKGKIEGCSNFLKDMEK